MINIRYKINDIASIYTLAQWQKKRLSLDEENRFLGLFIPIMPDGIRLDVRMLRGELPMQNGFIIVINNNFAEKVDPYYLSFELMSIKGSVVLLYDKEKKNYRSKITKNGLFDYEIEVPDIEDQFVYAQSSYLVDRLKAYLMTKKDDKYNQLRLSLFTEVMDALSIEHIMGSFFSEMDIHIYDPWKCLLEKYDTEDKQYINELYRELISQDSEVMNGVRKVRIAIKNIAELYKKV